MTWLNILSFILGILFTIIVEYGLVHLAKSNWGKRRREQLSLSDRDNGRKLS